MSYGVGTCILPIVRRALVATVAIEAAFLTYDVGLKPALPTLYNKLFVANSKKSKDA
ncbi:conserved hypothetical protein [Theileria equi strain WA]|uniref:Signal peptide containing protein n=1 Tax=Theileria equi strain WA TaxID=1537102 RepID=L1LG80_THEEQ|nr:conserved hypothetical protein [Theileria equi strain WA]EKX74264.1 conserved hypothetical protein [Theileria equi strain WA]|eukprot:XP_004833716.1 conserved hypothetical protein [Theileria equi strain WA]